MLVKVLLVFMLLKSLFCDPFIIEELTDVLIFDNLTFKVEVRPDSFYSPDGDFIHLSVYSPYRFISESAGEIIQLGSLSAPGGEDLYVEDGIVYIVSSSDGIIIGNVTNPTDTSILGSLARASCVRHSISTEKGVAALACQANGLYFLDISDFSSISELSHVNADGNFAVVGDSCGDGTPGQFKVFTITNPASPIQSISLSSTEGASRVISTNGDYAYGGNNRMYEFHYKDGNVLRSSGSVSKRFEEHLCDYCNYCPDTTCYGTGSFYKDDLVFFTTYGCRSFLMINVETNWLDFLPIYSVWPLEVLTLGVFVSDENVAYIAAGNDGLLVAEYEKVGFPTTSIPLDGTTKASYVVGNSIYALHNDQVSILLTGTLEFTGTLPESARYCKVVPVNVKYDDGHGWNTTTFQFIFNDTEIVCGGHGDCSRSHYSCVCDDQYYAEFSGGPCTLYYCFDKLYTDDDVCDGIGECVGPDQCICTNEGDGINDDCSIPLEVGVDPSAVYIPLLGTLVPAGLIVCFCICCCLPLTILCCICVCTVLNFICCTPLCGLLFTQTKKLNLFGQLRDFDILMKEQELEKDTSIAHLKINRSLFSIPYEELEIKKIIGEGGSASVVFLALWKGKKVAFKCFKTRLICSNSESYAEFEHEVEILGSLSHPHVLTFYGATMQQPRIGIVMEFCENGDLLDFVLESYEEKYGIECPMGEKIRILHEVAMSMDYLHSRNVIHRDLKLENVLVDGRLSCKLMDFGLSKIIDRMSKAKTTRIGTNVYMAPELLDQDGIYTEKCDVFSFGIMIWILVVGKNEPYGSDAFNIELKVATDPDCRPKIAEMLKGGDASERKWLSEMAQVCWSHKEEDRYSFDEIVKLLSSKDSEGGTKVLMNERIRDSVSKNSSRSSSRSSSSSPRQDGDLELERGIEDTQEEIDSLTEELDLLKSRYILEIKELKESIRLEKKKKEVPVEKQRAGSLPKKFGNAPPPKPSRKPGLVHARAQSFRVGRKPEGMMKGPPGSVVKSLRTVSSSPRISQKERKAPPPPKPSRKPRQGLLGRNKPVPRPSSMKPQQIPSARKPAPPRPNSYKPSKLSRKPAPPKPSRKPSEGKIGIPPPIPDRKV